MCSRVPASPRAGGDGFRASIKSGHGFDNPRLARFTPHMPSALGVIGGGNMGSAIVRGALRAGVLQTDQIIIAEVDARQRDELKPLGCAVTDNPNAAARADQILLAVKPQVFPDVARAIGSLPASAIVISIMAGRNTAFIRTCLGGSARIVRAMPNTPCQIGEGMTAIALGAGAQAGDEKLALQLFNALGRTVMLDESLMHAVTAVSGSGPAYVFLLAEAMQQAAVELGIAPQEARLLVSQTILGSGKLLVESERTATQLRQAVTSPGGTTSAALEVMFENELPQTISEALLAARNRGIELEQG